MYLNNAGRLRMGTPPPMWLEPGGLGGGGGVNWLLGPFRFTTDAAAPLPSPYTEPGAVGALDIRDTGATWAITGGAIQPSGPTAGGGNPRAISGQSFARSSGLTAWLHFMRISSLGGAGAAEPAGGWVNTATPTTGSPTHGYVGDNAQTLFPILDVGLPGNNTQIECLIPLRSAGAFFIRCVAGVYSLIYVTNTGTTTPLFAGQWSLSGVAAYPAALYGKLRVAQLGGPWATDYGISSDRKASASAGDTLTHEANCLVEGTWTAVTSEVLELDLRRTDDNNRWIVRCDQAGSTIKLIEEVAGVETERASAAQTWTNTTAYRIVVIADANTIRTYVANVAKNTYASASFQNTATQGKTDKALANFISWPRQLSGAALAELQRHEVS